MSSGPPPSSTPPQPQSLPHQPPQHPGHPPQHQQQQVNITVVVFDLLFFFKGNLINLVRFMGFHVFSLFVATQFHEAKIVKDPTGYEILLRT